jgi:hypothetical protein
MIRFRQIALTFGLFFTVQLATKAQTLYGDVQTFSQLQLRGSARTQAMGGVNNALGADIASTLGNPAGLGLYRFSELSISPSLSFANSTSSFLGENTSDSKASFNITTLGGVFNYTKDDIVPDKLRGYSFGISINRINSFHRNMAYQGLNTTNSMIDYFAQSASGYSTRALDEQFKSGLISDDAGLAWATYLIDTNGNNLTNLNRNFVGFDTSWYNINTGRPYGLNQRQEIKVKGSMYQVDLALGTNYDDKIYIGGAIGIVIASNTIEKTFTERPETPQNPEVLRNYTVKETLSLSGLGINARVGVIARPNDILRLGATIQTPTAFSFAEQYNKELTANFTGYMLGNYQLVREQAKLGPFEDFRYNLTTPWRLGGGASVFLNKKGFIAADVEYVLYNRATMRSRTEGVNIDSENDFIKNFYKPTLNYSIGGEYRMNAVALRLGFSQQGNPLRRPDDLDRSVTYITTGIGTRTDTYFFDVALVNGRFEDSFSPYNLNKNTQPRAVVKNTFTNVICSVGMFF